MFDTMFTEPVPARVFEMYRVVNARKTVKRSELEELLVPDALYPNKEKPNYLSPTLNTAIELGILGNVDNNITALVDSKDFVSLLFIFIFIFLFLNDIISLLSLLILLFISLSLLSLA